MKPITIDFEALAIAQVENKGIVIRTIDLPLIKRLLTTTPLTSARRR